MYGVCVLLLYVIYSMFATLHCVLIFVFFFVFFFFKQKTAYEMRISDWSSDVCSSDLGPCRWSGRRWAPLARWRPSAPCRQPARPAASPPSPVAPPRHRPEPWLAARGPFAGARPPARDRFPLCPWLKALLGLCSELDRVGEGPTS